MKYMTQEEEFKKYRTEITVTLKCGDKIISSVRGLLRSWKILRDPNGAPFPDSHFVDFSLDVNWMHIRSVRIGDIKELEFKTTEITDTFNQLGTTENEDLHSANENNSKYDLLSPRRGRV